MTRLSTAVAAAAIAATTAGGAVAEGWSVNTFFSQRVEADSDIDGGDSGFGAITDLGLTFAKRTAQTDLRFATGARASLFTDSDNNLDSLLPSFRSSLAHRTPGYGLTASLGFVPRLTDALEALDAFSAPELPEDSPLPASERTERTAVELNLSGSLGLNVPLDARNSSFFNLFANRRDYLDGSDAFEPTLSYGATAGWRRLLDRTTTLSLSTTARQFQGDESDDSRSLSVNAGLGGALTSTLDGNVSAGVVMVDTDDPEADGGELAFNGSAGLTYRTAEGVFRFAFAQSAEQDRDGALVNRSSFILGASHALTRAASVSVGASYVSETPFFTETGDDGSSFNVSPSFSYRLTSDWGASVGYRFRVEDDQFTDPSNLVFLQVSRNLVLLP